MIIKIKINIREIGLESNRDSGRRTRSRTNEKIKRVRVKDKEIVKVVEEIKKVGVKEN